MKKLIVAIVALLAAGNAFAQADTTKERSDTLVVGNFIIIKKNREGTNDTSDVKISKQKRKKNVSTNWFVLDLGFANLRDETAYGSAEANGYLLGTPNFTKADMKLVTNKTSNVNVWFFMQKLNVASHVLNLKYGLGAEMYNFRYSNNISYREKPTVGVIRDSVDFSKNKLFAAYATVPFMVNINVTPHRKQGLGISAGVSAGYLISSRNKQVSDERGKQKIKGDFELEKWRLAYIGELSLGPVRLYASYSTNRLHERGLTQYPYAVGVRFSNW